LPRLARRLARCTLELGGKSAAVLLEDFDPATALPELTSAMLQNNGQICGAQTRLLIDRRIYERTLETLAAAFRALQVGDPRDAETDIGPVITAAQRDHLEAAVGAARSAGGRVIAGGGRPRDVPAGFYVAPTLIADLAPDAPQVREELFGPIIVALPFDSEEEAIRLANDSPYGLAGSVWTSDLERGAKFATGISAGTVSLNVKAYVKRNKNDAADAEAICEAVRRPTMRFVQVKAAEQQGQLMLHRARDLLMRQRTR
jgi:aldehyde dehydrogenase (NAD+)